MNLDRLRERIEFDRMAGKISDQLADDYLMLLTPNDHVYAAALREKARLKFEKPDEPLHKIIAKVVRQFADRVDDETTLRSELKSASGRVGGLAKNTSGIRAGKRPTNENPD